MLVRQNNQTKLSRRNNLKHSTRLMHILNCNFIVNFKALKHLRYLLTFQSVRRPILSNVYSRRVSQCCQWQRLNKESRYWLPWIPPRSPFKTVLVKCFNENTAVNARKRNFSISMDALSSVFKPVNRERVCGFRHN